MTDDGKSKETERNIIFPIHCNIHDVDLTKKTSTSDPSYICTVTPDVTKKLKLDFSKGTALRCLDTIVQPNDIMEARMLEYLPPSWVLINDLPLTWVLINMSIVWHKVAQINPRVQRRTRVSYA